MDKINKKLIIFALVVFVIVAFVFIRDKKEEADANKNEAIHQISTLKSNGIYEIHKAQITTSKGTTTFTAKIKNVDYNNQERQRIVIALLDKDGNEIGTLTSTIPALNAGSSTDITIEDSKVYKNVYDYKIK